MKKLNVSFIIPEQFQHIPSLSRASEANTAASAGDSSVGGGVDETEQVADIMLISEDASPSEVLLSFVDDFVLFTRHILPLVTDRTSAQSFFPSITIDQTKINPKQPKTNKEEEKKEEVKKEEVKKEEEKKEENTEKKEEGKEGNTETKGEEKEEIKKEADDTAVEERNETPLLTGEFRLSEKFVFLFNQVVEDAFTKVITALREEKRRSTSNFNTKHFIELSLKSLSFFLYYSSFSFSLFPLLRISNQSNSLIHTSRRCFLSVH